MSFIPALPALVTEGMSVVTRGASSMTPRLPQWTARTSVVSAPQPDASSFSSANTYAPTATASLVPRRETPTPVRASAS